MHEEDALLYILDWLRRGGPSDYSNYGYDVYVSHIIRQYQKETGLAVESQEAFRSREELSPVFLSAAWELARRGIIRPGVRVLGLQATDEGNSGSGFSITPFGQQWLTEEAADTFIPSEPGRFAEMLEPFRARFGPGFYSRAQEAVRCYGAHAYLACCAMCGAGAESILLATAIAKSGDEAAVLKKYASAGGRGRVERVVLGGARGQLQRELAGFSGLLKYWRDEAAHGVGSVISDNEAYTSLALLLRYAMVVDRNWAELVRRGA